MDNGHPKGNTENPYFTAGIGDTSPEVNADLENSLDEKEWQKALEISTPVGLPPIEKPQEITTQEITTSETPNSDIITSEISTKEAPIDGLASKDSQEYELGQITPIAPLDLNQPHLQPSPEKSQKYNPVNIKTTGDKLEKSTIPEIDNVINELSQTGNLTNFYDEIRGTDDKPGMMETNLDNSFNRKLGKAA